MANSYSDNIIGLLTLFRYFGEFDDYNSYKKNDVEVHCNNYNIMFLKELQCYYNTLVNNVSDFSYELPQQIEKFQIKLSYCEKDAIDILTFIRNNNEEDFTLVFYDIISSKTIEIKNKVETLTDDDILNIVNNMFEMEHTFGYFVGKNNLTKSYIIGINFTMSATQLHILKYKNGNLIST